MGSISPPSLTSGSRSNDDGDVNDENGKKARGLNWQNITLHVHHAFFVNFFTVSARLQRKNT